MSAGTPRRVQVVPDDLQRWLHSNDPVLAMLRWMRDEDPGRLERLAMNAALDDQVSDGTRALLLGRIRAVATEVP